MKKPPIVQVALPLRPASNTLAQDASVCQTTTTTTTTDADDDADADDVKSEDSASEVATVQSDYSLLTAYYPPLSSTWTGRKVQL